MQKTITLFFSVLMTVALTSACTSAANPAASPTAGERDQVSVQLSWIHNHEFTGFYMADDLGYYDEAGLDVSVQELGDDLPVDALVNGDVDFAVLGADEVLLAREAGKPVVAVTAIYQRSPIGFVSMAGDGIERPEDLIGKKVYLSMNTSSEFVFRAMMQNVGLDPDEVELIERTDFSNDMLTSGEVDVMDVWVNNQPIQLTGEGHEINTILPFEYGVELYPDVITTTEEMIAEHPDLVARFVAATVRGLQAAVDTPDRAAELAVAKNSELDLAFEQESMRLSIPLITPSGSQPGMMTEDSWSATYDMLLSQGILTQEQDISGAFNLDFLTTAYSQSGN